MEHAHQTQFLYLDKVFFFDGLRNEYKLFIVDLPINKITYPIFIIQVKHFRLYRFYQRILPRLNGRNNMT